MATKKSLETLKYVKTEFILSDVSTPRLRLLLSRDAHWTDVGDDSYSTKDLGAAVRYKQYADERTAKILKTVLQEHYPLPEIPSLPGLDPHQLEGLKWILTRKRSYLAHAPGAGKTCTVIIAACLARGSGQNIFIVPPGLTANWEREIMKFTEWLDLWPAVGVVGRSDNQDSVAWNAEFLVVPDSMLTKDWVYTRLLKAEKKVLVVDEASRFKETTAERSLAFYGGRAGKKLYMGIFRTARHVVFLDGSPMPNRPIELWAPAYALHPESIGYRSYDEFGYRFCGARPNERGVWEFLYSSNEQELRTSLRKDFMHVVPEEGLSHPERRRKMVWMDQDVRTAEYRDWQSRFIPPAVFHDEMDRGDVARFRKELGLQKTRWVADYVHRRLKEKNESILLFAWHREVIRDLEVFLSFWDPFVIMGGTPAASREKSIAAFQSGECRILILNIAAAGRGHNLQRANRVIFAEWSWTDELNKQCEKRAARRGSEEFTVPCDYIVAPDSLDERTLRSVFSKERRVKKIIG